jgi:bifunctional DNA-binding transcriptional regulator/antitoxin component of YhaV-PrlF toxin-antitoxin module
MVISMLMKKRMKISKGGQVSIPAPIRKRWGTTTVTLEDQGDQIVFKPAPDDPIEAAAGAFADEARGPGLDTIRREEREAELEAEERKFGL